MNTYAPPCTNEQANEYETNAQTNERVQTHMTRDVSLRECVACRLSRLLATHLTNYEIISARITTPIDADARVIGLKHASRTVKLRRRKLG